jgi:pimeloyl-ACP methyl ester carboxylesterase
MTSLQLGLDAPEVVSSLAVVNATASVKADTFGDKVVLAVRALLTKTLGPAGVARLVAPRLFPLPEQAHLRETFIRQMSALDPRTYAAVSRAVLEYSVEARVGALKPPVLFVAADADYTPVATKQALAARISGAKVVVVPDSHHAVPIERPEAFNAVIDAWLAAR